MPMRRSATTPSSPSRSASRPTRLGTCKGRHIGRVGTFPDDGVPIGGLLGRVAAVTSREPVHLPGGPERVRTIGIVSGSAAGSLGEAVERGLDAFLTGEPKEHVMG